MIFPKNSEDDTAPHQPYFELEDWELVGLSYEEAKEIRNANQSAIYAANGL